MTEQPPQFEIREARPAEYEAVGEICVLAYGGLEGETDIGYHAVLRNVAGRAALVDVLVAAEPHGALLGTVTYVPGPGPLSESEREDEAGFRMLAVAPWSQGRGVGRALVEACIERARAAGKAGLAIYTRPSMKMAHRLYEAMGFQRDKSSDWEFEPGEWLWGFRLRF